MAHIALSRAFESLIDVSRPVSDIATGFMFTEGPIWHPIENHLLFSDMPGDVRRRWDQQGGVSEVKRPANKCNGMTYDANLDLIVCEHSTSQLVRERRNGNVDILASHFEGKELNSPNDVCVHSSGWIYFTDPWYGRMPVYGVERPRQLGFQGVYRVSPAGGDPQLLVDRRLFDQPNGICFCPDESKLYVNDTEQAVIRVFEVRGDGTIANGRIFASGLKSELEGGVPDGMKCDAEGNVWCTAPGGVWVYDPRGNLIGKIRVPEVVGNLHWGGNDFSSLYFCASTSVYRLPTKTRGRKEPFMTARPALGSDEALKLDPSRTALIIQDMQNDVVMDGGAFAASGSPAHCREQNNIANIRRLAEACRKAGVMVIHVWFVVDPGAPGLTLNAPLFEGVVDNNAMVRGSWGSAPVPGLEPVAGDFIVEKMRMSAFEGTILETILKAGGRDVIISTGAWTNMSVEHTARTGADKGYFVIVPEDCCSTMNAEWHNASVNFALQNVSVVTKADEIIAGL
jgi:gluconolactonase